LQSAGNDMPQVEEKIFRAVQHRAEIQ
jgi:hypothetical protein